jgi:hypothetical protein
MVEDVTPAPSRAAPTNPGTGLPVPSGRQDIHAETTSQDLRMLVGQVWPGSVESEGMVVVTRGRLPTTHRPIERYLVLPSIRRPAILVPATAPARALAVYTAAKSTRAANVAGAAGRILAAPLLARSASSLTVGVRTDAVGSAESWSVIDAIARDVGAPGLLGCLPVRRYRPGSKPVIAMFDPRGTDAFWAKVGWSPWTRRLIANEYQAISRLYHAVDQVAVPRPVASGAWASLTYSVTEALSGPVPRWRESPETNPGPLRSVMTTGDMSEGSYGQSAYSARLGRHLERVLPVEPEVGKALTQWHARLRGEVASLRFAQSHGDWVPWNLGTDGHGIVAWDWEHSQCDAPVGFDFLHWHFQTTLARPRARLTDAVAAVDRAAGSLELLGIDPAARGVVVAGYLLDILTRGAVMAAEGAGWNQRLRAGLTEVADSRGREESP